VKTSIPKSKIRVLLLESIDASAIDAFTADGYTTVDRHARALTEPELIAAIHGAHLLGIRSRTQLTKRVLDHADKLIAIGCFCIGTDQVDVAAAETVGIPVFNAPFSNTRSVAELVIAEIVMLCRGIPQRNAAAHRGEWLKAVAGATEVRGKTLGVVGYGHIGTQVGLLAEALGMRVIYHDLEPKLALGNAEPVDTLRILLQRSDVVTLHVPDTSQTRHLVGAEQLGQMRRTAHLINASRGNVVDIDALAAAIGSGAIAGAAIDVFPREPESNAHPFVSPLTRFDNVLLTPHIGGNTIEAQESIGLEVAAKLLKYSNNGSTMTAVNFPEVSLPEHRGKHRLLHTHRNVPGMLAAMNAVLAEAKINVASQYLETSQRVGYAVIDVDGADRPLSATLRKRLDAIEGTIRTRVLY